MNISSLQPIMANIQVMIMVIAAILHVLFASGVARDIGNLNRMNVKPQFISGSTWVMATLIGGVFVLLVYWLFHHSSLARSSTLLKEYPRER